MKKIVSLFAIALTAVSVLAQTSPNVRFNSLNAMVQYTPLSTNVSIMVTGSASPGDGGLGGDFFYDSASSAATNTYGVFKPASTTGRYIRRNSSSWNQFTAATANDGSTYAFSMRRNLQTNVFNLGADNNNVYLQSQASYALHLNNLGNDVVISAGSASGKLGIGGTPTVPLHVLTASESNILRVENTAVDSNPNISIKNDAKTYQIQTVGARSDNFELYDVNNAVTRLAITTSGNIGIGVTAPTSLLSVNGVSAADTLVATNGITVGAVAAAQQIKAIYSGAAQIDFPSIAVGGWTNMPITVTGAGTNSVVSVSSAGGSPAAGVLFTAYVSATNTVQISGGNVTLTAIDPATTSYRVTVFQY